jgi:hypothetical protein
MIVVALNSQSLNAQEFNAGIFGGVTASQVDGDTYGGFNKIGLTAGAFVNRELDYNIYWQLEIKYVSRGAYENYGPDDPRIYKTSYHYLELPLSVHYLFDGKIQAEIGISPEVLISYASFDEYGKIENDPAENRPFGLSAFAGIYYWFIPSTGVGLRYTYSAIPFRDPQEWHNAMNRGYFHNVLCLTLAFKFYHP